jgi:DnaJ-class molecular chaperone
LKVKEKQEDFEINLPPGVSNLSKLKLRQKGNFIQHTGVQDLYTDVDLNIDVESHETLSLNGVDVICNISISLIDALKGKAIEVDTIAGKTEIQIKEKTKSADVISLSGLGVRGTNGSQKCIIEIQYPKDIDKLINFLEGN